MIKLEPFEIVSKEIMVELSDHDMCLKHGRHFVSGIMLGCEVCYEIRARFEPRLKLDRVQTGRIKVGNNG